MAEPSIIHLFLHRLLIRENSTNVLFRKQVMEALNKHVKINFSTTLRERLIKEMITAGLLENINRDKVRIINPSKSDGLETIINGNYRSQRRAKEEGARADII